VGVGGGLDGEYDGAEADLQKVRSAGQRGDSFAPGTPTSESGRSTAAVGITSLTRTR
jgi:hypothetical protein